MKVQDLLTDETKWTQGYDARDADGACANPSDPQAVCWCLGGAILLCYPDDYHAQLKRVAEQLGVPFVVGWNDDPHRRWSEVRALIEELDL